MICGWLSIGRFADRFECGQIALVMRQQGAEYAVADIFSVAYISLCSYLLTSLDKPVSKAAHVHTCAAAARPCSRAVIQAVVCAWVVTRPTLKAK